MSPAEGIALAFPGQARIDQRPCDALKAAKDLPACAWLHLLQMYWEKTAKAYLAASGTSWDDLKSHAVTWKFLEALKRSGSLKTNIGISHQEMIAWIGQIQDLSAGVEALCPASAGEGRPNAEYPWLRTGAAGDVEVLAPFKYGFDDLVSRLNSIEGRRFLKLVACAMEDPRWSRSFGFPN